MKSEILLRWKEPQDYRQSVHRLKYQSIPFWKKFIFLAVLVIAFPVLWLSSEMAPHGRHHTFWMVPLGTVALLSQAYIFYRADRIPRDIKLCTDKIEIWEGIHTRTIKYGHITTYNIDSVSLNNDVFIVLLISVRDRLVLKYGINKSISLNDLKSILSQKIIKKVNENFN